MTSHRNRCQAGIAGRLPPFGKQLLNARKAGRYINPWIFAGRGAWEFAAQRGPGRLVLPAGEDPAGFNWSCTTGLDVVVRWPGASLAEVEVLGALLVRSGACTALILEDLRLDPAGACHECLRPHRRFIPQTAAP